MTFICPSVSHLPRSLLDFTHHYHLDHRNISVFALDVYHSPLSPRAPSHFHHHHSFFCAASVCCCEFLHAYESSMHLLIFVSSPLALSHPNSKIQVLWHHGTATWGTDMYFVVEACRVVMSSVCFLRSAVKGESWGTSWLGFLFVWLLQFHSYRMVHNVIKNNQSFKILWIWSRHSSKAQCVGVCTVTCLWVGLCECLWFMLLIHGCIKSLINELCNPKTLQCVITGGGNRKLTQTGFCLQQRGDQKTRLKQAEAKKRPERKDGWGKI